MFVVLIFLKYRKSEKHVNSKKIKRKLYKTFLPMKYAGLAGVNSGGGGDIYVGM